MNLLLPFLALSMGIGQAEPANWSGAYAPCNRHADLLGRGHLDLGVRISTPNPTLAREFSAAMDFWRGVLDLQWHEVTSSDCAIQVVDGVTELFDSAGVSARSQLPDRPGFEGWIAFNPRMRLTERELYLTSVHEIGHLLGLHHSEHGSSVMFFLSLDEPASLDADDLNALSALHELREGIPAKVAVPDVRAQRASRHTAAHAGILSRGPARYPKFLR